MRLKFPRMVLLPFRMRDRLFKEANRSTSACYREGLSSCRNQNRPIELRGYPLCSESGANVQIRTEDAHLFRVPLYQLSYGGGRSLFLPRRNVKPVFQAPGPPVVEFHAGVPSDLA